MLIESSDNISRIDFNFLVESLNFYETLIPKSDAIILNAIDDINYFNDVDEIKLASLQYFLASLCDWKVKDENKKRLGLRYSKTPG